MRVLQAIRGWLRRHMLADVPEPREPWDTPTAELRIERSPTLQPPNPLPAGRHRRQDGRRQSRGYRHYAGAHSIRVLGRDAWDRLHAYLIWARAERSSLAYRRPPRPYPAR